MGRAFRVVKRTAHLTVRIAERPLKIVRAGSGPDAATPKSARAGKTAGAAAARKPARKTAAAKA
jgi:hypothetical protein